MKICKYAFDKEDEYCATCDGVQMEIDGNLIPCDQCAGYEDGPEDANVEEETPMVVDTQEDVEQEAPTVALENAKTDLETAKKSKTTNNTKKKTTSENSNVKTNENENSNEVIKTVKDKKVNVDGVKVTSIRFTSGATVKKGDNYFKFVAEKELDLSAYDGKVEDAEEQLWADLNSQIDKQVEDLQ